MKEVGEQKHVRVAGPRDQSAFEEMYRRHLVSLQNIVWRYARTSADADDLLQDATVKALTNWERFDPTIAKFTTWFGVIVRNCAIDSYRKAAVRPVIGVEQRTLEGVIDPEFGHDAYMSGEQAVHSVGYRKAAQIARDALVSMPHDQREVIELESAGLSHMQMGTTLGEPLGTVKSRVRIARVKLRRILGNRGITADTLFGT